MRYVRTFHIQAAHFNSEKAYQTAWRLAQLLPVPAIDVLHALTDCHGHNFAIDVHLIGTLNGPWLVDDVELAKVVMAWDNTNLSMHPDFIETQDRATTENMAAVLLRKIERMFEEGVNVVRVDKIVVWETPDIHAEARL